MHTDSTTNTKYAQTMETTPISGLDELDRHVDDLVQDPDLALNAKLFDDVELQLTGRPFWDALLLLIC